uniref:Mos1 transposase HTH domain-containing protein n=1 Tax=Acrobeloides nanus TaxID=290746 RepID=A0A914CWG1_9BILA
MRTANHILIRNVLLFYFDQNKSAADAFHDLNETYGDGTISRAQFNGSPASKKATGVSRIRKEESNQKKAIWCVWWDRSGIIHWEIIAKGPNRGDPYFCFWWDENGNQQWRIPDRNGKKQKNLNSDVYLAQMDRLEAAIAKKRPRKKNNVILLHDDAKPHVERRSLNRFKTKAGKSSLIRPTPQQRLLPT